MARPRTTTDPGEPLSTTDEMLAEIRRQAFAEGVAEGLRQAAERELPLFERAKQLARDNPRLDERAFRRAMERLQDEREEHLSASDFGLVVGYHRRVRLQVERYQEAVRAPGRPRRTPPSVPTAPVQTEYEHIS